MTVRITVPASSANLGSGFDSLGLALDLRDEVEAEATFGDGGLQKLRIDVQGVGADEVPRDERHLVVRAMLATFAEFGVGPREISLSCRNTIPHGRGLGSSAAAIVAGVLAARALACTDRMPDAEVLAMASRLEGHPDNVAACQLGGLTIAWTDETGTSRAVRHDVHPDVRATIFLPEGVVATEVARGLLPNQVPHADAAHSAARAALLVTATTRRPDLLFEATDDRLHQAYRAPAMPGTIELVSVLRDRGVAAVVSGAGPSVLVLTSADDKLPTAPEDWRALPLGIAAEGASATLAGRS